MFIWHRVYGLEMMLEGWRFTIQDEGSEAGFRVDCHVRIIEVLRSNAFPFTLQEAGFTA